ncbi:hypothetical protein [Nostoc sp.]|uniref:hypothetical protein n=1 Tax=Nostoc sp. TaxID=1180 RepID=UPI002FFBCE37
MRSAKLVSERFEHHSIVTTEQAHALIAIALHFKTVPTEHIPLITCKLLVA